MKKKQKIYKLGIKHDTELAYQYIMSSGLTVFLRCILDIEKLKVPS